MTFRRIDSSDEAPLRVVVAGAGGMGRAWLRAIAQDTSVELVGLADLDVASAAQALQQNAFDGIPISDDAVALAVRLGAQALVDVTVPAAHHPVTTAALTAGLAVLGEKPVAATLAEALSLAAAAEVTGELFMVSQSRRWNPQLFALREQVRRLGPVSTVTTEFFKAAHFPGFREEMDHPLLVDMAIHPFDSARFLTGAEPVSVYCEAYNPPWSWFAGAAAATAAFTMDDGSRYVYTGSWCAPGAETSWNGSWRVSGAEGAALWSGDAAPTLHLDEGHAERMHRDDGDRLGDGVEAAVAVQGPTGIAWALQAFTSALRTGESPMGEVHENVMSLAMVEAAVESAERGERVLVDAVLDAAHTEAVRLEQRPDVRERLTSWPSVRAALVQDAATAER